MDPSLLFSASDSDPSSALIGLIVAILLLVVLSAYFSASEMAFSIVNKVRLRTLEQNGDRNAQKVLKMMERDDRLLSTILVGNNIVNIVSASLSTVLFTMMLVTRQDLAVTLSTIVMTIIVLICGEITPKTIVKACSVGFVLRTWRIMKFFTVILYPIELLLIPWKMLINKLFKGRKADAITEDELITYVETAQNEGGIDAHESQLIRSAIEFEDLDVEDIMVPRVNVDAIEEHEDFAVVAEMFFDNGYSRMPVYCKTIDAIIGVIHEKDFFGLYFLPPEQRPESVKSIVQPAVCVSSGMKISTVLRMLQKAKIHMAIVVDEFGGTAGIVTLEDILEELVGEIWDEHDEVEILSRKESEDTYLVSGSQNLTDMFAELGIRVREEFDSTSVGGFVIEQLNKIPAAGEQFDFENLQITVLKANARRVLEIRVRVLPVADENQSHGLGLFRRDKSDESDGKTHGSDDKTTDEKTSETEDKKQSLDENTTELDDETLGLNDNAPESKKASAEEKA